MDVLTHWLAVDPLDGVTVGHGDDPEALAAEFPACRIEGVQVTPPGGVVSERYVAIPGDGSPFVVTDTGGAIHFVIAECGLPETAEKIARALNHLEGGA